MSKFNLGDKVKNVQTNEVGYIIEIYPPHRGRQIYKVKYDTFENTEKSSNLLPDVNLTDPFERCCQNIYGGYSEYLKSNTIFKIQSSNNSTISSLKASKTLFKGYQFQPLLKFLNSDNRRILIADEVGLGKTIEAGHIMLELKAREELRNALIICPVALRTKWAIELNDKFGLDFIEIETKEMLMHELKYRNGHVRAVINYEKIGDNSEILSFIAEKHIKFSIIVCDESHKLRNNNTHVYKGAELLLSTADSVVFMSATPIMLNEENLYNQLHLLDPSTYNNVEVFINNIQLNKPFVKALNSLNHNASYSSILKELTTSRVETFNTINDNVTYRNFTVDSYFKDYPIYKKIKELLNLGDTSLSTKAEIQYNLSEMSPMSTIFTRTRKRDVTQDWSQAERNPYTQRVNASIEERKAWSDTIERYIDENTTIDGFGKEHRPSLGLCTLRRQLASCVWATISGDTLLDQGIDEYEDKPDAKIEALIKIIRTVFEHGQKKIIVFAIFKKTLKYLQIRLKKHGYNSVLIYGNSKIDKQKQLIKFRDDDNIQVLLSSEVGSEGLDMQFCNSLVNYDLPWNPMVVEQRIGRIDRFGQKSKKVNIYNIVVTNSILEDIFERLLMRIGIFKESIGDLEAILDLELPKQGISIKNALENLENDFYSDKLTHEEVERKRIEIEQAIENERLRIKDIEEGLTNCLTNDAYFKNEIEKILHNRSYVTSNELYQFVIQIIKEHLTTCELKSTDNPEIYQFIIPKSDSNVLKKFLNQFEPTDAEGKIHFNRFIHSIENELVLNLTFNQEYAFEHKELIFINIYHPIVVAGTRMFRDKLDKTQNTFYFELKGKDTSIKKGLYILGIYKIEVVRELPNGKSSKSESLYPVLFDLINNVILENQNLVEEFMGITQTNGNYAPLEESCKLSKEIAEDLRYDMKDKIDAYMSAYKLNLLDRIENSKRLRYQQTLQYYETRTKNLESSISTQDSLVEFYAMMNNEVEMRKAQGALRLLHSNLRDLNIRKEEDLEKINSEIKIIVREQLMSLNLIKLL